MATGDCCTGSILGWGADPFGGGPWGGGGPFSICCAVAITVRSVRVSLTGEPQRVSVYAAGSAQNPSSWVVELLDSTGAVVKTYTITEVVMASPYLQWEVKTIEAFEGSEHILRVRAPNLKSLGGLSITSPTVGYFRGVLDSHISTVAGQLATRRFTPRDLANPPFSGDGTGIGGTLQTTAGGDYASEEGVALAKKMILRRLTTKPGGFFHLRNYGIGLREDDPLPRGQLVELRALIERELRQEPGFRSVKVNLFITPESGLVEVAVNATIPGDRSVTLSHVMPDVRGAV